MKKQIRNLIIIGILMGFIGFANAFPKLLKDVFGYIRVDEAGQPLAEAMVNPNAPNILAFAFLGAAMGAAIRPLGGWLSDKLGGARVTHWDTLVMILATLACGYTVSLANSSPTLSMPLVSPSLMQARGSSP